ncbi:MAG TPA: amidohydrolase family protein [Bryobacteraceae bacterium]|nr:amidohydrolase family protein [Bryobacteraceae bacterium]
MPRAMRLNAALLFLLCLGACKPTEVSHPKAIVGAVLLDGQGGPPVSDSVVIVADGRIMAAGPRSVVAIPQGSETVDGSSRYMVPIPIDVCAQAVPPGMIRATTPDDARAQVAKLAATHATVIHIASLALPVAQATMEAARAASIPVIAHISTEAEAEAMVTAGAAGFVGMIRDRDVDPAFASKLRDLRIFFAPALGISSAGQDIAKRNTLRLFQTGVPIAVASAGGNFLNEVELLSEAGIPPLDVLVAATRNGAAAVGKLANEGTIQPGKIANLMLLSANPGDDIRNLRHVFMRVSASVSTR